MKRKQNIRSAIMVILVLLAVAYYLFELYQMQIVNCDSYLAQADRSGTRTETVQAARGLILDRNGKDLAINVLTRNIVIDKAYVADADLNTAILRLCRLLEKNGEEWFDTLPIYLDENGEYQFEEKRSADISGIITACKLQSYATAAQCMAALIEKYDCESYSTADAVKIVSVRNEMRAKEYSFRYPYTFAKDVSIETVSVIEENPDTFLGVRIENGSTRQYVEGDLAPHTVGIIGSLSAEQYQRYKDDGYALNDTIGQFGIESKLESVLRGTNGERTVTINTDGEVEESEITEEPIPGNTVYLTIDSDLQRVCYEALERNITDIITTAQANHSTGQGEDCSGGAAVVMDVHSGEVLADVTYPSFNLETYAQDLAQLVTDNSGALTNRSLEAVYPPGSVMKPAMALAGLNEGIITENSIISCNKLYTRFAPEIFQCLGWHGNINVKYALQVSCNCFFYEVGYQLGISRMNQYCTLLGLGQKTGIELNEAKGTLAGPGSHTGGWYSGDTIQAAIGQSDNTFTIMQIASYISTIANGGTRYQPTVVHQITDYSSRKVIESAEPEVVQELDIQSDYFRVVRTGMRQAVTGGSVASVLANYPIPIAGKTGTAQAGKGSDHGLLALFAPYDDPEIAIIIVLEHGGHGYSAAYTALDILNAYFGIETETAEEPAQEEIPEGPLDEGLLAD